MQNYCVDITGLVGPRTVNLKLTLQVKEKIMYSLFLGMLKYLKVQVSSLAGSLVDFLVSISLVYAFHIWYIYANAAGNLSGNLIQFFLSRNWVFKANQSNLFIQLGKYSLFWVGNILLQAGLIYLLKQVCGLGFLLSKTVASIIAGLTYNYYGQKLFVFRQA